MATIVPELLVEGTDVSNRFQPEIRRILIVHESALSGSLIASVLSGEAYVDAAEWVTTIEEALRMIENDDYDVILVAATLPDRGAMKLTEVLVEREPRPKVVVVGVPETAEVVLQYVMAGATGYVSQGVSAEGLLASVQAVARNETLVSPNMAASLIAQTRRLTRRFDRQEAALPVHEQLTPREEEVLALMAAGCSNSEIAGRLWIAEGTVKNHVHHILKKLGAVDRQRAAAFWRMFQQSSWEARPAIQRKKVL